MKTVWITELTPLAAGDRRVWSHRTRAKDRHEAISRCVKRHWGKRATWQPDSGLADYGQVFRAVSAGQYTSVTARCRVDVRE